MCARRTPASIVGPVVLSDDGDRVDCGAPGQGGYSVPSIVEPEFIPDQALHGGLRPARREGHAVEPALRRQVLAPVQLRPPDGQTASPPRGGAAPGAPTARGARTSRLRPRRQRPLGYYIYSVVKQGSINLAFESERMAIPKAKFIGLSSSDADTYGLPRNVGIKLNDKDVSRAKELIQLPLVPEEGMAGRDQADARDGSQVRARCARQQGLPLPEQRPIFRRSSRSETGSIDFPFSRC